MAVARRIAEVRRDRGWTAADLGDRCAAAGFPALNRSVIANIETGRRNYVSVDELIALAYVFDVPPISLLVPRAVGEDVDEEYYAVPSTRVDRLTMTFDQAREWIRGRWAPSLTDARKYWNEVPVSEWSVPRPSEAEIDRKSSLADFQRRFRGDV